VWIENPETGAEIAGAVTLVADRAGTNGAPPDRIYVEVEPEELPDELIGQNVKVTIPVSTTEGEVLAVPAAALSARADGSTIVQVDDDGVLRTVEVTAGLAAEGLVSVEPASGELSEGDLVVVGREDGDVGDAVPAGPEPDAQEEAPVEDEARAAGTAEGS
jgi:multidrug efflux pump subunit AcrA (membrane-fusion protein)